MPFCAHPDRDPHIGPSAHDETNFLGLQHLSLCVVHDFTCVLADPVLSIDQKIMKIDQTELKWITIDFKVYMLTNHNSICFNLLLSSYFSYFQLEKFTFLLLLLFWGSSTAPRSSFAWWSIRCCRKEIINQADFNVISSNISFRMCPF